MKITEIDITDQELLIDTLINSAAMDVASVFQIINKESANGSIFAVDILSRDDIADFVHEVKTLKLQCDPIFSSSSQTMKLIAWLLSYLQE